MDLTPTEEHIDRRVDFWLYRQHAHAAGAVLIHPSSATRAQLRGCTVSIRADGTTLPAVVGVR